MDRKLYKQPFNKTLIPQWLCPTCGKGVIHLLKDSFFSSETKESRRAYNNARNNDDAWAPDYIEYVYSCQLECSSSSCKEIVVSLGIGYVGEKYIFDEENNPRQEWIDFFKPKYFQPHLKPFSCPEGTPANVVNEIEQSFQLLFCNPSSASNHIRIALEHLLTHLKVRRLKTRNGPRHFLSLHQRIGLVPNKHKNLEDLFLAIKWLGNAGSHSSITIDDVLDAYEMMELVLGELFANTNRTIKKLAKKINKKKGPK